MQELYTAIDKLNIAFDNLELKLKGVTIKRDGLRLSFERYGSGNRMMRLCWDGKPLSECKAEEKVDAAEQIEALLATRNEIVKTLTVRARVAAENLTKIVKSFSN